MGHLRLRALTAVFLAVGYSFIGSTWLIHKTEGALQLKVGAMGEGKPLGRHPRHRRGVAGHAFRHPRASSRNGSPFPRSSTSRRCRSSRAFWSCGSGDAAADALRATAVSWLPFAVASALFALAYLGMAYSFYPYVVPER
jgi:cytochrome d ubiquinol oxidase subunit II